jgi:hypothetical protein
MPSAAAGAVDRWCQFALEQASLARSNWLGPGRHKRRCLDVAGFFDHRCLGLER